MYCCAVQILMDCEGVDAVDQVRSCPAMSLLGTPSSAQQLWGLHQPRHAGQHICVCKTAVAALLLVNHHPPSSIKCTRTADAVLQARQHELPHVTCSGMHTCRQAHALIGLMLVCTIVAFALLFDPSCREPSTALRSSPWPCCCPASSSTTRSVPLMPSQSSAWLWCVSWLSASRAGPQ